MDANVVSGLDRLAIEVSAESQKHFFYQNTDLSFAFTLPAKPPHSMSLLLESRSQEINKLSSQLATLIETNSTLEKNLAFKQKARESSNNHFNIHKKSIEDLRSSQASEIFKINKAITQISRSIQDLTKLLIEKENTIASLENKLEILNPPELENIGLPSEWKYMECNEIEYEAMSPRYMEAIYKNEEDSEEKISPRPNEALINLIEDRIGQSKIEQNIISDKISFKEEIKENYNSIEYTSPFDSKWIEDHSIPLQPEFEASLLNLDKIEEDSVKVHEIDLDKMKEDSEKSLGLDLDQNKEDPENHPVLQNDEQELPNLGSLLENRAALDTNLQLSEHIESVSDIIKNSDLVEQQLFSVSSKDEEITIVEASNIPSREDVKTCELSIVEADKELSCTKAADNIKNTKETPPQKRFFAKYQPKVIPKRFQIKKAQDDDFFDELAKP